MWQVRLALTEALLAMSASAGASELMRSCGLYAVLRESHLAESEAPVKQANEDLVFQFKLSDAGPPPEGLDAGLDAGAPGADPAGGRWQLGPLPPSYANWKPGAPEGEQTAAGREGGPPAGGTRGQPHLPPYGCSSAS